SLCLNLAKTWPKLFGSFRDYTFQIFLMGIFFQMAIRWGFVRLGQEWLFVPLWLSSVVVGVYVPTLIAKYIQHHAPKAVRLCFGL
ncbi:MAG: acyltransferase, partial [Prevotella sp.]|nr:acyltransferase [Prevotella sp.]